MSDHVNIENDKVTVPYYAVHKDGLIAGFFGIFRFLSNFYILEDGIWFEELTYPSVEHAYQASKWPPFGTHLYEGNKTASREAFLDIPAWEAKELGKLAPKFNKKKWEKRKMPIMAALVRQKFDKNYKLRQMLCETEGFQLEERNNWGDKFWGTDVDGVGENNLGKILMDVRDTLKMVEKGEAF